MLGYRLPMMALQNGRRFGLAVILCAITLPVTAAESPGTTSSALEKLPLETMREVEPRITEEVFGVLGVANSVRSRTSYGGTAPRNVRREANRWLKMLARERG